MYIEHYNIKRNWSAYNVTEKWYYKKKEEISVLFVQKKQKSIER